MSIEENKNLVRHVIELWNQRDFDNFLAILAPSYIEHLPSGDISREQLRDYAHTFFTAFPDIRFTIEEMIAEGDKVAVLLKWKGTHKGEYMNISPTGKKIEITVANIIRIMDRKWVEFWNVTDMRLIQQLGDIPYQEK